MVDQLAVVEDVVEDAPVMEAVLQEVQPAFKLPEVFQMQLIESYVGREAKGEYKYVRFQIYKFQIPGTKWQPQFPDNRHPAKYIEN